MTPREGEIWKHYKGTEYDILHIAEMQTAHEPYDMKECVVYKAKTDGRVWVRPLLEFIETVNVRGFEEPRFMKVS